MLNVDSKMENGVLDIALEGELDTLTSPGFLEQLETMLEEANVLTLDFAKLTYISSAGLRVLLAAEQIMEDKGAEQVRVINANDTILNLFAITGFNHILMLD